MLELNHLINEFLAGDPKLWIVILGAVVLVTNLCSDARRFLAQASLLVVLLGGVAIGTLWLLGAY